ncbi:methyl-accepting chemotaxis protein [Cellulomonas citrea]|uniref:methyl-accepting chemotaxis protein n=1 Tax=Cellulomonas citrea TaxID=1909423 RepID=UPI0013590811|nr:methyl-accepting chemotaxis protein [Cellulomonas citrea]
MTARQSPRSARSLVANLGVRIQVLVAVGIAAVVAVTIGLLGLQALSSTSADAQNMYSQGFLSLENAATLKRAVVEARLALAMETISADAESTASYEKDITTADADLDKALADYQTRTMTDDQRAALNDFTEALTQYRTLRANQVLPAARAHDVAAFLTTRAEAAPFVQQMMTSVTTLVSSVEAQSKASADEATAAYHRSRTVVIVVTVVGVALALLLGTLVAGSIVGGMAKVRRVAEALSRGDLREQAGLTSTNEVGATAQALDQAVVHLRNSVGTIDDSATALAAAAEEMSASSQQISSAAEETATQAGMVSAAAEQVSRSIQGVAAGSEQMGASISEIARNANDAARVAAQAVAAADTAGSTVARLGDSSREIGNVVKLITQIAEQTNLLALNATIEAARAGEAGKGFAVVAGEVKELAQETAKATGDISSRVQAIQDDTESAVGAIGEIATVITSINDYQLTIASAVEEQTTTTSEVNRSVNEAAAGSGEIAQSILGVAGAADQTTRGAAQSQQAAGELARMSAELTALVGTFTR